MYVLNEQEEYLCKEIVSCAYAVHYELGPGLLEKVYETCFCHELKKRGIPFKRQVHLPIVYDGLEFDNGLVIDILVADMIICEFKAVETVNPIWQAQIMSHIKLSGLHVGFLINFNARWIKDGTRRYCIE
ncbi:GxxExxY protein [Ferruginibacter sp. HRS2-29]|uniref:GxxExxY protein n=1 Tax=Ferruginibacter sp. HRS2-29 TaxID=2487334 RepID=UPI0020CB7E54|nr:GxxExxY protein [Ferruginibacter sp. HRS2-29]MCP9752319.1 GxxExxY protein [Ferruginibacter sp. HRS2-29]